MPRLTRAPNLAVATLWVDLLAQGGITASVQRAFAGSIAGQIPPDQALPEVWIDDDENPVRALALLDALRSPQHRRWCCHACGELVEGPFEQCWNCGAGMPPPR